MTEKEPRVSKRELSLGGVNITRFCVRVKYGILTDKLLQSGITFPFPVSDSAGCFPPRTTAGRTPLLLDRSSLLDVDGDSSVRLFLQPSPLVLSSRRLVVASPLDAPPSHRLVVPPLVVSSRQKIVAPSSLVVLSLHHPLVLSWCWLVVPLIVVHHRDIERRRTLLPLSNTTTTATI